MKYFHVLMWTVLWRLDNNKYSPLLATLNTDIRQNIIDLGCITQFVISVSVVAHSMSSWIEISGYCAKYSKHQTGDWSGATSNPDNPFSPWLYNFCGWNIEWPANYRGIVCFWSSSDPSLPHNCLLSGASISDSSAHNIGPSLSTGGWSVRTATVSTCRLM